MLTSALQGCVINNFTILPSDRGIQSSEVEDSADDDGVVEQEDQLQASEENALDLHHDPQMTAA